MVAGATLDIEANEVRNVFGNMSAGDDLFITANTVMNQALGASQVLLEVHKKPDCFTCHEGEVDFYDTFGGRIEALGTVSIAGNLTNVTLNSSDMSLQDVMDEMNAYIQAQREASDPLMAGVPDVSLKNFHLEEKRDDDFTAPVENLDDADRVVIPVDTGNQTDVEVALTITPDLAPTAPLDALLAAGLNTIAETDPEFTEYGNFITSNYMMDVDRLQYRDELINNTSETILAALNKADVAADVGDLGYLDQPVSVPARDGSGSITVYPSVAALELDGTGALISGTNVVVSGSEIDNSGAVHATENVSMTAGSITGNDGSITADAGEVALTALGSISFEDTTIDGAMIDIIAGQDFTGKGVAISSETDASIYAVAGVTLTALENEYELTRGSDRLSGFFGKKSGSKLTATEQVTSSLSAGGDLSIITSGDLVLAGLQGEIGGDASLSAEGDLLLTAVQSTAEFHSGGKKNGTDIQSVTSHVTALDIGGDLVATAGGQAVLVGTQIDAGGQVELAAAEDVVLAAAQDIYLYESRKSSSSMFGFKKKSSSKSITRVTNQGARIAAAGDVDVVAEAGDLTTAGAEFVSNSGDINLTAVEGDIYAGTYTDVFEEKTSKSSGMFWGLISSSSQSSSVDQINTGTDALASLDLSLVSGEDTTLVGALLSAGQTLNIETGGDFSVQAAIDSQRSEFFSQNAGLVTMTTIQESSYVETAVLTQLLAAQALNLGIGGQAELTLYDQAGVDAPAPEDLYPDELLALAGLELLTQDLANEYFYDKQTSLSPAFKALVSVALSLYVPNLSAGLLNNMGIATTTAAGSVTALGTGANAFASTFILESLDGIVSGDFDLGQILEGAVFSGVSAGLSAGISNELFGGMQQLGPDGNPLLDANGNPILTEGYLSDFISSLPDEALLGFGQGELTFAKIMQGALDGAISSGVNSAIYGTDFMDGLSASVLQTVANLMLADVQFEIGELFKNGANGGEGSLGHALLHGLAGCAAAEAQGADCAAGAAGGIAGAIYSGMQKAPEIDDYGNDLDAYRAAYDNWRSDVMERAQLVSLAAGYIFSGGKAENVSVGASVGTSAVANNYLTHDQLLIALEADKQLAQCKVFSWRCSAQERTRLENIVQSYRALSAANTARLIEACSAGASTCTQMLADARAFTEATNHGLALMAGGYAPGPENFYVRADGQLGYGGMVDIDEVAVRYFTRAENGEMTYAEAAQAIESSVLNHESNMTILVGGVQIVGGVAALGACPSTGGLSCLLLTGAIVTTPNVVLGANEASEGVAQWLSGQNERTAIEDALIRAGYSAEDAARYLGNAQLLVGVLDIGVGGVLAIKGPLGTARVNATNKTLNQSQIDDLVARKANGETLPDPSTYMSQADIDAHLAQFDDGAVRFTTRSSLDEYGTAGGGDAFVMPKSEFDRIVADAGGDMRVVEQRLNLNAGSLSNGDAVALYVPPENLGGIRIPSGNEAGANSQWVPGGYTASGTAEAVVDLRTAPIIEIEF